MKLSLKQLKHFYSQLPAEPKEVRDLFDSVGLEVKRFHTEIDDTFLTLELLANRGDQLSYWGVATELAGRCGGSVQLPHMTEVKKGKTAIKVSCESDLCLQYSATELEVDDLTKTLPADLLYTLEVADIHSVDGAVDTTNLVNLELGQPTHLFDADTIVGGITIRLSKPGEQAWPLFTTSKITLPENTLVIADDEKVLAIAGVIGCEESKVTSATKKMILESATFDPVSVRKTARALNIHTDSSARFERGADTVMMLAAVERIVFLLEQNDIAHATSPVMVVGNGAPKATMITIDADIVARYLQLPELSAKEICERLERYGFTVKQRKHLLDVTVPTHRYWDVKDQPDLYEEIARSIGYDELPAQLPAVEQGALPSHGEEIKARVNELLMGNGFYEVFTDGFYGRDIVEKMSLKEGDALYQHVEVANAIDRGYSLLKRSCFPQALQAVSHNLRFQTMNMKLFEWTRIFVPEQHDAKRLCHELPQLWMMVNGVEGDKNWNQTKRSLDIYYLKGIVETLAKTLKLPFEVKASEASIIPIAKYLHPYRQAEILLYGKEIGILGEVHPTVCKRFDIKRQRPCYLELNLEQLLMAQDFVAPTKVDLPAQLPIRRSLAFTLPYQFEAATIKVLIEETGKGLLDEVEIVDSYLHGEQPPARTITYDCQFNNETGELTAEQVNEQLEEFVKVVEEQFKTVKLRA